MPKEKEVKEVKYKTSDLLKSKHLKGYQQDFAKALLKEPEYTISDAKKILENYYEKRVE